MYCCDKPNSDTVAPYHVVSVGMATTNVGSSTECPSNYSYYRGGRWDNEFSKAMLDAFKKLNIKHKNRERIVDEKTRHDDQTRRILRNRSRR